MDEQLICRAVEQAVREAGMAVMTLEKAKRLIDKVEKKILILQEGGGDHEDV